MKSKTELTRHKIIIDVDEDIMAHVRAKAMENNMGVAEYLRRLLFAEWDKGNRIYIRTKV